MKDILAMVAGGGIGIALLLLYRWVDGKVGSYKGLHFQVDMLESRVERRSIDLALVQRDIESLKRVVKEMKESHD